MSGRHQPLNGADSAEALADVDLWWLDGGPFDWMLRCAACSLPAKPGDTYCVGHARLMEYRPTDETHWASNE